MTIRRNYESTVAKGRMTQDALERTMALITPTTTFDGFDRVDIVVEAVFENMDVKTQTFAELARRRAPTQSSHRIRRRWISTSSEPRADGRRRSSATTSSAPRM